MQKRYKERKLFAVLWPRPPLQIQCGSKVIDIITPGLMKSPKERQFAVICHRPQYICCNLSLCYLGDDHHRNPKTNKYSDHQHGQLTTQKGGWGLGCLLFDEKFPTNPVIFFWGRTYVRLNVFFYEMHITWSITAPKCF